MHEDTGSGRAGLALPRIAHTVDDTRDSEVQIGIGQNDAWILAPQFQGHGTQFRRGITRDRLADRKRPGKRDLADKLVFDQRLAAFLPETGDNVEDARRQFPAHDLGEKQDTERRLLGRFDHHAIPRDQRGGHLGDEKKQRRIPWDNPADHTNRVASGILQDAR